MDNLSFSFPILMLFISLFLIALAEVYSTILNKTDSTFGIILAVDLSYIAFMICSFYIYLWKVFSLKWFESYQIPPSPILHYFSHIFQQ